MPNVVVWDSSSAKDEETFFSYILICLCKWCQTFDSRWLNRMQHFQFLKIYVNRSVNKLESCLSAKSFPFSHQKKENFAFIRNCEKKSTKNNKVSFFTTVSGDSWSLLTCLQPKESCMTIRS